MPTLALNLAEVFENALTAEEWWAQFEAVACCPDAAYAALVRCGCRGSGQLPAQTSSLLLAHRFEESQ